MLGPSFKKCALISLVHTWNPSWQWLPKLFWFLVWQTINQLLNLGSKIKLPAAHQTHAHNIITKSFTCQLQSERLCADRPNSSRAPRENFLWSRERLWFLLTKVGSINQAVAKQTICLNSLSLLNSSGLTRRFFVQKFMVTTLITMSLPKAIYK